MERKQNKFLKESRFPVERFTGILIESVTAAFDGPRALTCRRWGPVSYGGDRALIRMRNCEMMNPGKTSLQRAFEIARSGKCRDVTEIEKQLRAEKYDFKLEGPMLRRQLLALIKEARKPRKG